MARPDVLNNQPDNVAPLIQRILSEPLQFRLAKKSEVDPTAVKPGKYTRIGKEAGNGTRSVVGPGSAEKTGKAEKSDKKRKNNAPKVSSMAQALASYTGKKYGSSNGTEKTSKKRKPLVAVPVKEEESEDLGDEQEEDVSDSDEVSSATDDDTNYSDAVEAPGSLVSKPVYKKLQGLAGAGSSSEDEEDEGEEVAAPQDTEPAAPQAEEEQEQDEDGDEDDDDDESDDDFVDDEASDSSSETETDSEPARAPIKEDEMTPDPLTTKKQLLDDQIQQQPSQAAVSQAPTTADESSEEEIKLDSSLGLDQFYKIEENANDRGSNKSTRIIKNWGPQLCKLKPLGLLNHGVTCYTNAAVQAMIHIPAVQHYLLDVLKNKYSSSVSSRSVTQTLAETSARMWNLDNSLSSSAANSKKKFINPKKLISRLDDINCMMSEWQQEDSHEYFMSLLSRLQEDSTPKGEKLNSSIIYDIFGGLLSQTVTCNNCGYVSKTLQEFYDLSLHLGSGRKTSVSNNSSNSNDNNNNNNSASNNNGHSSHNSSNNIHSESVGDTSNTTTNNSSSCLLSGSADSSLIEDSKLKQQIQQENGEEVKTRYSIIKSIKDFFSKELIKHDGKDSNSGYLCEKCSKRSNAIKISKIARAPETLTIHLKRFRFNGNNNSSSKVKQGVSYPLILDLSKYTTTNEPTLYQLISVVVHEGRSVSSGHYVAHCRQPDGSWATYDDEYVNTIPQKQALRDPSAYYLIYTRLTHKDVVPCKVETSFGNVSVSSGGSSKNGSSKKRKQESGFGSPSKPKKTKLQSIKKPVKTGKQSKRFRKY